MAERDRSTSPGPRVRSPFQVAMRHALLWVPATVAVVFLAVTGVIMLQLAAETKRAVLVNLYNTCANSETFRSHELVEVTCWQKYDDMGGGEHP